MRPENERLMKFIRTEEKYLKTFAEKTGIPLSTLTNIKSGRNSFSVETLLRIKSFYPHMDINYIITGNDLNYSYEDKKAVEESVIGESEGMYSSNNELLKKAIKLLVNQKDLYERVIASMKKTIDLQEELLKKKE